MVLRVLHDDSKAEEIFKNVNSEIKGENFEGARHTMNEQLHTVGMHSRIHALGEEMSFSRRLKGGRIPVEKGIKLIKWRI